MSADPLEPGDARADAVLAEALDRFVEHLQDGREVDPQAELRDRPDLRERVLETYELARALVERGTGVGGERWLEDDGGAPGPGGAPVRFGDFRLIRRLGAGGMGVVYVAEQESLHRLVALKLVHRGYAVSESMRQRFTREAQAIARLRHPNIVTVHAIGEVDGTQYLAMELLPGQSLERVLVEHLTRRQPVPLQRFVAWSVEIASALGFAHDQGVVHRDVKPGNIHITPDGHALLLDFGLARDFDDRTLSRTGSFQGSPHYAPPEQVRGERVGPAADVYALGVTLYECLAGKLPFVGRTTERVFHQILTRAPQPLRERNPRVSRDLETVVAKAMEKDVADRYASALDLADDLDAVLAGRPVTARPPGAVRRTAKWARRNKAWAAASGVVLLAIAAIIVALWVARGIAQAQLEEVLRLSDLEGVRALEQESEHLWPRRPQLIEPMRDWLRRADALEARRGQHRADLRSAIERALARQRAAGFTPAGATEQDWSRADQGLRWRVTTARTLLEQLDVLDTSGVRDRLAFAEKLEADQPRYRAAWEAAIADIASLPHYAGVRLTPNAGIVPLRRDPASGLWEFWHVGTGVRPELLEDGTQWKMEEDTGLVLVLLPGARFLGQRGADHARVEWKKPFEVDLDPFLISKYEMTQGQWRTFTGRNPSDNRRPGNYPVESVSWRDCEKVLPQLGLAIPTEAQWEYACRAGATTKYATGDSEESLVGFINAQWEQDPFGGVAPVGSLRPNAFGLYNMNGNLIEWCRDPCGPQRVTPRKGDGFRLHSEDPHAQRVTKGGGYQNGPGMAACSGDSATTPTNALWTLGIRPVMSLQGQ